MQRAQLPSAEVMATWTDVGGPRQWADLKIETWQAIGQMLGDAQLNSITIVSAISPAVMSKAIADATMGQNSDPLTPIEAAKASLMYNGCRTKFGFDRDQRKLISNQIIRVGFAGTFAFVNLPSFVTRTDRFTSPDPCRL